MADYRFPGEHFYEGMVLEEAQSVESIEKVRGLKFVEGDLLIASYPKTGTTWMEEVAWTVTKEGDLREALAEPLTSRMLFLECSDISLGNKAGVDILEYRPRPAIMKTHLPAAFYEKAINEGRLKIILTIRNPKDTLVSLYHFYRTNSGLGNFTGTWDEFFELYKIKHLLFGDYFDWYASWLPYLDRPNVQIYAYEDMKADMKSVLQRLAGFLGKSLNDDKIAQIIEHTSFKSMKSNKMTNYTNITAMRHDISPFMRKGEVGDWKNYFSDEQNHLLAEEYEKKLEQRGLNLKFALD